MLLAASAAQASQNGAGNPHLVEVFTTTEFPVSGETVINQQSGNREAGLYVYELDGIQRIETELSRDLSADPEQSKRIVLQRLQKLGAADRAQMQRAAMGLAKAVKYGVDRYPAIVFDGQMVVYGVTDLEAALQYYRAWWEGSQP